LLSAARAVLLTARAAAVTHRVVRAFPTRRSSDLLAQADPDDWQAAALLTRACAESGDMSCRDSGMVHMLDLHRRGITPPNMQQYVVERVKTGENILLIRMSLEPWGRYKVYALGQLFNSEGKTLFRVTLES